MQAKFIPTNQTGENINIQVTSVVDFRKAPLQNVLIKQNMIAKLKHFSNLELQ